MTMDEADRDNREQILTVFWTAMLRAHDINVPGFLATIIRATAELSTIQLAAACTAVMRKPPKAGTPLLGAILDRADTETKERQLKANADGNTEPLMLPPMNIDRRRRKQQDAILRRYARRPNGRTWSPEELAACKADLEADSADLAAYNARVADELAHFRDHSRFPAR